MIHFANPPYRLQKQGAGKIPGLACLGSATLHPDTKHSVSDLLGSLVCVDASPEKSGLDELAEVVAVSSVSFLQLYFGYSWFIRMLMSDQTHADPAIYQSIAQGSAANFATGSLTRADIQSLRALQAQMDAMSARISSVLRLAGEDPIKDYEKPADGYMGILADADELKSLDIPDVEPSIVADADSTQDTLARSPEPADAAETPKDPEPQPPAEGDGPRKPLVEEDVVIVVT